MPDQPTNARLLFIKQAIPTTAWPELCVMLLDAMQEQQNQINALMRVANKQHETMVYQQQIIDQLVAKHNHLAQTAVLRTDFPHLERIPEE